MANAYVGMIKSETGEVCELYGTPRQLATFGGSSASVGPPYQTADGRAVTVLSFGTFRVAGSAEQWKSSKDESSEESDV